MPEPGGSLQSTREAVQPSLWDRLVSDLTGVASEIDGLLIMTPVPERLRLRTFVDLESGLARTSMQET